MTDDDRTAPAAPPAIAAEHIAKRYGQVEALRDTR
jgi:hypothetical protein